MPMQILGPNDPALRVLQDVLQQHREWETTLTIVPWPEYRNCLFVALTSAQAPYQAVCVPGHVWIPELIDAGYLAPLNLDALPDELVRGYKLDDIVASVARECYYDGRLYMIPWFTDGHILLYRADKVSLLSPDVVPIVSPRDIRDLAADAHNPPGLYGLALKADPSEIFLDWLPFLWEEGGDVLDVRGCPAFTGKAGVRALETYCSLRKFCPPDTHTYGNAEIVRALKSGMVALATTWGGQAAPIFLDPNNPYRNLCRAAIYPAPWNATWGIALPANKSDTNHYAILKVLLKAAGAKEDRLITRMAGSPVRENSYVAEEMAQYPWLCAQYKMLQCARNLPLHPRMGKILGVLSQAVCTAFTWQETPREALARAELDVWDILKGG